ncbi:hypothetical protein [Sphingobium nicotianae]|uniref:hypothetical protein n=1 Tax=Sphingobium nicotianae TaxID=2782607 RepID=UPI001BE3EC53|nr:hypothetical protein [Sphingobium nicotianae]
MRKIATRLSSIALQSGRIATLHRMAAPRSISGLTGSTKARRRRTGRNAENQPRLTSEKRLRMSTADTLSVRMLSHPPTSLSEMIRFPSTLLSPLRLLPPYHRQAHRRNRLMSNPSSGAIPTSQQLSSSDPFFSPILKVIEEGKGREATDGRLACRSCPGCNWLEIETDRPDETELKGKCLPMGGDIAPFGRTVKNCDAWHRICSQLR